MGIKHRFRSASFAVALIGGAITVPAHATVPGLLPSIQDVPVGEPLPIDGIWTIRELGKRIAIDKGRGWAVDTWVHAFVFQIMPNQVVLRNFQVMPDGTFLADDLPLMSKVRFTPQPDGSITAQTQGMIPVTYHLDPNSLAGGGYGGSPVMTPPEMGENPVPASRKPTPMRARHLSVPGVTEPLA